MRQGRNDGWNRDEPHPDLFGSCEKIAVGSDGEKDGLPADGSSASDELAGK